MCISISSKIKIIKETDEFFIVSKPSGLLYHRSPLSKDKIFLLQELRNLTGGEHIFPVHRLDRATSGISLVAKSSEYAKVFAKLFEEKNINKEYIALVKGVMEKDDEIELDLINKETKVQMKCQTNFKIIIKSNDSTLILVSPVTGKRHQIRRHLKKIHHHIIGDTSYGQGKINRLFREKINLYRLFLHSFRLSFIHPLTGEKHVYSDPIPEELKNSLFKIKDYENIPEIYYK